MLRAPTSAPAGMSAQEWRLVSALREIPSDALRSRLTDVAERLAGWVRDPRCAEMQADGVPCEDASTACEECRQVGALLEVIERRLSGA